jgi:hypothetical protein
MTSHERLAATIATFNSRDADGNPLGPEQHPLWASFVESDRYKKLVADSEDTRDIVAAYLWDVGALEPDHPFADHRAA